MKKIFAAALALALLLALVGCHEGMISSKIEFYSDGSGVKTIVVDILGDNTVIPGNSEGSTVGNNSNYMLVTGDALKAKFQEYSALKDGVTITVTEKDGNTQIVYSYTFSNIADYNAKTKTLAEGKATELTDATYVDNGNGTFTFSEPSDNTQKSIFAIIEKYFNDTTAFSKVGDPNKVGQSDADPVVGVNDMHKMVSVTAIIGDTSKTEKFHDYENGTEPDYEEVLTVTGTPKEKPVEKPEEDKKSGCGSELGVIGFGGVALGLLGIAAAAIIAVKFARNKKENN